MMPALQLVGAVAIVLGLVGTWLAGRQRTGWLICIVSSALWLPALVTGDQWAAVVNCGLSIAICVRNFQTGPSHRSPDAGSDQRSYDASTGVPAGELVGASA